MNANLSQSFDIGLWLFGAGGHAKVVIATLRSAGMEPSGIFDDDPGRAGQTVLGVPVVGRLPLPGTAAHPGARGLIAIGDNRARQAIAARYPGLAWATAIHRSALVDDSAQICPGTVVFANSVVQPDSRIGAHTILNTGAQVDHDCDIGSFVHVASGSCLGGGVRLGEGAFLGVGCVAVPYIAVGEWTTVGAGAAITGDLPAFVTAVGVPARVIRKNDTMP